MGLSQLRSFDDNKTKAIGLPFYYINKTYINKFINGTKSTIIKYPITIPVIMINTLDNK